MTAWIIAGAAAGVLTAFQQATGAGVMSELHADYSLPVPSGLQLINVLAADTCCM